MSNTVRAVNMTKVHGLAPTVFMSALLLVDCECSRLGHHTTGMGKPYKDATGEVSSLKESLA